MRRVSRLWFSLGIVLAGMCIFNACQGAGGVSASGTQSDTLMLSDTLSALDFGLRLQHASGRETGNFCLSPLSIRQALGLVAAGAGGESLKLLKLVADSSALDGQDSDASKNGNSSNEDDAYTQELNKAKLQLRVANAAWVDTKFPISKSYANAVQERFRATVESLPLATDAQLSSDRINGWVKDKTEGLITELVTPGVLVPGTELVLTNAVYFKSAWARPFEKDRTLEEDFHSVSGDVKIPMMHGKVDGGVIRRDGLQALVIPYAHPEYGMMIVMPDSVGTPLTEISAKGIEALYRDMDWLDVNVSLPRFKFTSKLSLRDAMQRLGLSSLFDGRADFSAMSDKPTDLCIGDVLHSVLMDVQEEGTEAAAATAVTMVRMALRPEVEFKVDRPFLYIVFKGTPAQAIFVGGYDPR